MKYLIANWKAQMTFFQTQIWIQTFIQEIQKETHVVNALENHDLSIIICPPFPFIPYIKDQLQEIPNIHVGAQTVSNIESGKFTGEVTAKALSGIADYAIIAHSERRSNFKESEQDIQKKIEYCQKYAIKPILCIRDEKDIIYSDAQLIAYEPVSAIGTGQNMNPTEVIDMKKKLALPEHSAFIYGGSADENNCRSYSDTNEVNGFLVGTASLDPHKFLEMAKNCI